MTNVAWENGLPAYYFKGMAMYYTDVVKGYVIPYPPLGPCGW